LEVVSHLRAFAINFCEEMVVLKEPENTVNHIVLKKEGPFQFRNFARVSQGNAKLLAPPSDPLSQPDPAGCNSRDGLDSISHPGASL
jgi:hypothetical protein